MKRMSIQWLLVLLVFSIGCTRHITPERFDPYPEMIKPFSGSTPLRVVVPGNAEKAYLIEYKNPDQASGKVFVDLGDMYGIAKTLMENELQRHGVPVHTEAVKTIAFTIQKVQWEVWAGGFSMGAYMDFVIKTGDGYQAAYSVQDGSAVDIPRAVGGVITRAVETVFQDQRVLDYIGK